MPKLIAGLIAVAALAAVLGQPTRARAEVQYPWCAEYSGNEGDGGTNCGFVTYAQCRAAISGVGGTCYENPAYAVAVPRPRKVAKPR